MNKGLLFLLVTLVQSQSDGIRITGPASSEKYDKNLDEAHSQGWQKLTSSYFSDPSKPNNKVIHNFAKRSANDMLTRRSALDKNFMRFGRSSGESTSREFSDAAPDFVRSDRGLFRLGNSPDSLIRFDRGSKDSFIRFGRSDPEDFYRLGKSMRDNFIRFGKADKNFMRFGRDEIDGPQDNQDYFILTGISENGEHPLENFQRLEKSPRTSGNFLRFGKNGNQKEGRNGTNFLRFGKKASTDENGGLESEYSDFDAGTQESVDDGSRSEPVIRSKRGINRDSAPHPESQKTFDKSLDVHSPQVVGESSKESKTLKTLNKRSPKFFEKPSRNYSKFSSTVITDPWANSNDLKISRWIPQFFPSSFGSPRNIEEPYTSWMGAPASGLQPKRNQGGPGGSNFIRFG